MYLVIEVAPHDDPPDRDRTPEALIGDDFLELRLGEGSKERLAATPENLEIRAESRVLFGRRDLSGAGAADHGSQSRVSQLPEEPPVGLDEMKSEVRETHRVRGQAPVLESGRDEEKPLQ